jgi:hypothetical protein
MFDKTFNAIDRRVGDDAKNVDGENGVVVVDDNDDDDDEDE